MNTLAKIARSVRAFKRELARVPLKPVEAPKRPTLGVALGGGFARGLAHVGVLKVLKEENIEVGMIAGTSVGAVIGAAYCSGVSPEELCEIAALVRFKDFARWTISRFGICTNDRMHSFLERLLPVRTFEELKLPLAVTATDFATGDPVVFRSGSLVDAVRASCAYPGMFLPVQVNGRLLVDGMLAYPVPSVPVRQMGATRVIGVYLASHWMQKGAPRHVFDVIGQCFSIAQDKMCGVGKSESDVVLLPQVAGYEYDGFQRAAELIRAGELATREALPTIRGWFAPVPDGQKEAKQCGAGVPSPAPAPLS